MLISLEDKTQSNTLIEEDEEKLQPRLVLKFKQTSEGKSGFSKQRLEEKEDRKTKKTKDKMLQKMRKFRGHEIYLASRNFVNLLLLGTMRKE
ncbi:hypothetical protein E2C01_021109 [Portunus trituberculatus]|uniref:Uncharacterized protein n=1 Tax=Portunus trituberculatus TaxID=210409 RepID=A0A5B7E1V1_PORTR|nr:hypothetical protein [Portunus trituberculatus]